MDFHVSCTNLICKKYCFIVLQLCSGTTDKSLVALAQQVKNCSFLTNSGSVAQNIPSQRNKCNKGRLSIIFYIKIILQSKSYLLSIENKSRNTTVSEFNEFEPHLKSAKNRFKLSAGLNLETLNKF